MIEDEDSELWTDPVDRRDGENIENEQAGQRKAGRPKIPEHWTRVISISTDNLTELKIYQIATDLLLNQGYDKTRRRKGEPEWEIHFSPQEMLAKHPDPNLEVWSLKEDRLKNYGVQVTNIRKWIVERAKNVDKVDDEAIRDQLDKITKLGKKLRKTERQLKNM